MIIETVEGYNFFRYKDVSIDLSKYVGTTFIDGQNGHGKSTLFELIQWTLFGLTHRYGNHSDEVIGPFDTWSFGCVSLKDGDKVIEIRRYRNSKEYGDAVMYSIDGKDMSDAKSRNDGVQDTIDTILNMDHKIFLKRVMAHQNSFSSFAQATDKDKKALMDKMLGLECLPVALKNVKNKLSEIKSDVIIKNKEFSSLEESVGELHSTVAIFTRSMQEEESRTVQNIQETSETISTLRCEVEEMEEKLETCLKSKKELELSKEKILGAAYGINTAKDIALKEIETSVNKSKAELKSAQLEPDDVKKCRQELRDLELEEKQLLESFKSVKDKHDKELNTMRLNLRKIRENCEKLRNEIVAVNNAIDLASKGAIKCTKDIENLKNHDSSSVCSFCGSKVTEESHAHMEKELKANLDSFNKSLETLSCKKLEKDLKVLVSEAEEAQASIDKKTAEIACLSAEKSVDAVKNKKEMLGALESKWKSEIELKKSTVTQCEKQKLDLDQKTSDKLEHLDKEKKSVENSIAVCVREMESLKSRVVKNKASVTASTEKLKKLKESRKNSSSKAELEKMEKRLKDSKEKKDTLQEKLKELKVSQKHYEFWEIGFGDRGLKSYIQEGYIPEMNKIVKEYMDILTNGTISAKFSATTKLKSEAIREKFDVEIVNKDGATVYDGNSGGEKTRIDLAIFMCLQKIGRKSRLKQMFFDETVKELDPQGVEKYIQLLKYIRHNEGISSFLISHDDNLKSLGDHRITVVKENIEHKGQKIPASVIIEYGKNEETVGEAQSG